jgi:hypothetical protein
MVTDSENSAATIARDAISSGISPGEIGRVDEVTVSSKQTARALDAKPSNSAFP